MRNLVFVTLLIVLPLAVPIIYPVQAQTNDTWIGFKIENRIAALWDSILVSKRWDSLSLDDQSFLLQSVEDTALDVHRLWESILLQSRWDSLDSGEQFRIVLALRWISPLERRTIKSAYEMGRGEEGLYGAFLDSLRNQTSRKDSLWIRKLYLDMRRNIRNKVDSFYPDMQSVYKSWDSTHSGENRKRFLPR